MSIDDDRKALTLDEKAAYLQEWSCLPVTRDERRHRLAMHAVELLRKEKAGEMDRIPTRPPGKYYRRRKRGTCAQFCQPENIPEMTEAVVAAACRANCVAPESFRDYRHSTARWWAYIALRSATRSRVVAARALGINVRTLDQAIGDSAAWLKADAIGYARTLEVRWPKGGRVPPAWPRRAR